MEIAGNHFRAVTFSVYQQTILHLLILHYSCTRRNVAIVNTVTLIFTITKLVCENVIICCIGCLPYAYIAALPVVSFT